MQRFTGEIEGFYSGTPDGAGFGSLTAKARHYQLQIYRAVVRRVQLLAPEPELTSEQAEAAPPAPDAPPPAPEPPEPPLELPPGTLRQDTIEDARLSPLRVRAGWFEGPIHDVTVSEFRSTHSARSGGRLYGRFVGRVQASFELPEKPLPERAQALLDEFTAPEAPEATEQPAQQPAARDDAAGADPPTREGVAVAEPGVEASHEAGAASVVKESAHSQVPLWLLVAVGAVCIFGLCTPSRAVIWLVFLLPTLLLRRILRGALADGPGVRAVSGVLVVGQLGCLGVLGGGWWANGCKEMALFSVLWLVFGVFATSILPSNLPLLVNGAALGLALGAWCSTFGERCKEELPASQPAAGRPSVNDPGVPRTNSDGSWPRRPPRDLPAKERER
jgi:hypothetical protein